MTNEAPQTSNPAIVALAPIWLQFIKEYFVVLSALAIVLGVMFATIFLYGYLCVFDWHLYWTVQYLDILTFALVAVAVLGGASVIIQAIVQNAVAIIVARTRSVRGRWEDLVGLAIFLCISLAVLGSALYSELRSPDPRLRHIVLAFVMLMLFLVFVSFCARHIRHKNIPSFGELATAGMFVIVLVFFFGQTLGYWVRESSGFTHNVILKDRKYEDVKVVLMTSHHTILYKQRESHVIPTDDIVSIDGAKK